MLWIYVFCGVGLNWDWKTATICSTVRRNDAILCVVAWLPRVFGWSACYWSSRADPDPSRCLNQIRPARAGNCDDRPHRWAQQTWRP